MHLPAMSQLAWRTAITESWLLCEDHSDRAAMAQQIAHCDYLYFGDSHPVSNNDHDSAAYLLETEHIPYLACHCFYQEQPHPPRCEPCYFISQALLHKSIDAWCEDILNFDQEAFVLGQNNQHELWMRNSNGDGYEQIHSIDAPKPMTLEELSRLIAAI